MEAGQMQVVSEVTGAPIDVSLPGDNCGVGSMKVLAIPSWVGGAVIGLACFLPITQSWAQQHVASQPGGQSIASAEMPADATATVPGVKLHDNEFVIGNGDVLNISVWKQPDLSRSLPVRSDGKISLPLIGEIQASGETPLKLEGAITAKYQPYLNEPEVTVIVEQINSQKFNILGRVAKPGSYPLVNRTTVLDAIALAGGCRDFAKQKAIYILRRHPDGSESKLLFNYREVIKGKNTAQNIDLQPHDTVVVP
jgi:polysaccharide export outer membrane protein